MIWPSASQGKSSPSVPIPATPVPPVAKGEPATGLRFPFPSFTRAMTEFWPVMAMFELTYSKFFVCALAVQVSTEANTARITTATVRQASRDCRAFTAILLNQEYWHTDGRGRPGRGKECGTESELCYRVCGLSTALSFVIPHSVRVEIPGPRAPYRRPPHVGALQPCVDRSEAKRDGSSRREQQNGGL